MQPPPIGLILVISEAFPSVRIQSRIGSSLKDATVDRDELFTLVEYRV